ncbi:hypothetical protein THMIRHAS_11790 [Thiosulfatimonas sediminis]|uniref:Retention module-containing protein n=1 Tax=Thiosulfatimonas sediminis TaxID=2675054 RepID=A0A6F8PUN1_9GAMM|nr:retention module-containing protein [Thiosulfatimonas sediminis]BBP45806.1 hypothetical protein THMIRHAS_11790 [Thiosulfatimonas sediminis]
MTNIIGTIKSAIGEVVAKNPATGEERILTEGSIVYLGEEIVTDGLSSVNVALNNGESLILGRASSLILNEDLFTPVKAIDVTQDITTIDALQKAVLNGNGLLELDATAAGEEESSVQGGVVVDRLGYEGLVDTLFNTTATQADALVVQLDSALGELLSVLSNNNDNQDNTSSTESGGNSGDSVIADVENIVKDVVDDVIPGNDNTVDDVTDLANGLVDDLIELVNELVDSLIEIIDDLITTGLDLVDSVIDLINDILTGITDIVNSVLDQLNDIVEQVLDTVGDLTDELTAIIDQVTGIVDDLAGSLIEQVEGIVGGLIDQVNDLLGGGAVELGLNAQVNVDGNLELNLDLGNLINDEGSVDQVVDGVTDVVDDLLGTNLGALDKPLDNVTTDVDNLLNGSQDLGQTVSNLINDEGSLDQVVEGVTVVVDDLLGTETEALAQPLDNVTTDVDNLLNGSQDLGQTVSNLINDEGSLDQVVEGVTVVVDDLLGTETEALAQPLDNVTTDVDNLLNGSQDLGQTVSNLINDEGSLDQVVEGVTVVVDDLLGTETEALAQPLDNVTTDVDNLLNGSQDLGQTVSNLINDEGSVDQVVEGVTVVVDDLLGTETEALAQPLDNVTTDVDNLLNGSQDLGQTVSNLINEDGSVDQVVEGVTIVVDDLLGTETGAVAQPLDNVTTDVDNLLNGSQDLGQTVSNLINDEGSVDQVVEGVTVVVDDLLGTETGAVAQPLDNVTTDVDNLLNGSQDLGETTNNLLGEEGSVDQVVAGATTAVDELLGTDLSGTLDETVDDVTTAVNNLIGDIFGTLDGAQDVDPTLNLTGSASEDAADVDSSADQDDVTFDVSFLDGAYAQSSSLDLETAGEQVPEVVNQIETAIDANELIAPVNQEEAIVHVLETLTRIIDTGLNEGGVMSFAEQGDYKLSIQQVLSSNEALTTTLLMLTQNQTQVSQIIEGLSGILAGDLTLTEDTDNSVTKIIQDSLAENELISDLFESLTNSDGALFESVLGQISEEYKDIEFSWNNENANIEGSMNEGGEFLDLNLLTELLSVDSFDNQIAGLESFAGDDLVQNLTGDVTDVVEGAVNTLDDAANAVLSLADSLTVDNNDNIGSNLLGGLF